VSRGGGAPGTKPNRVRLSAEERDMAEMMGMTLEEYGKNKRDLQREGKLH
jgi:phage I-like protein